MKKSPKLLRLLMMAMMIAFGVVISPILRVEGMCPMAHFINVVCAVMLGPLEAFLCAVLIGIIRMVTMGIPPLALTGAVFGAFFSGMLYRLSKGKLLFAVIGEVFGTGIIGAIISYPVMTFLWGRDGLSWLFYVPSFIAGTLVGGSIAFAFLKKLANNGLLEKYQQQLGSSVFHENAGVLGNSLSLAATGVVGYTAVGVLTNISGSDSSAFSYIAKGSLIVFTAIAVIYYIVNRIKTGRKKYAESDS